MLYGRKQQMTQYRNGSVVDAYVTYSEDVRVADDTEVLAEFLKLMDYVKKPGRFNPEVKVVTDRKTGRIDRIVKSWCELN